MMPPRTSRRRVHCGKAFTIVEILATLTLAAIVLPVVVNGVLLCLATADHARHQARAASLAQSKLAELLATGEVYDAEMTGDFGEDMPGYAWSRTGQRLGGLAAGASGRCSDVDQPRA